MTPDWHLRVTAPSADVGIRDAGSSGSGQTVKHDFSAAGTYEVTLTVASGACGTSSTSSTVTVP
jgi:PKD repeat protein